MDIELDEYRYKHGELENLEKARTLFKAGDGGGCIFLLKRLVSEGSSAALAPIGLVYETGCGSIKVDLKSAVKWYLRSIEEIDDVLSHRSLARVYLQDSSLDPDHSLAKYHLELLAENDVMGGFFGLGLIYQHGIGVPRDKEIAASFFNKAVATGHLTAKMSLHEVGEGFRFKEILSMFWTAWRVRKLSKEGADNEVLII